MFRPKSAVCRIVLKGAVPFFGVFSGDPEGAVPYPGNWLFFAQNSLAKSAIYPP